MTKTTQIKNFDRVNGLGTISFSPELVTSIIKKVLSNYPNYVYLSHTIEPLQDNYHEFSVRIKTPSKVINFKEIDRLQKELLLVIKQSLSLTCVVIVNIDNE
ncbi:MAG: hypothetical protein ACOQNY_02550 [Mycoplasmoidaceae bacterium]